MISTYQESITNIDRSGLKLGQVIQVTFFLSIFPVLSGSDPLYKIPESDLD